VVLPVVGWRLRSSGSRSTRHNRRDNPTSKCSVPDRRNEPPATGCRPTHPTGGQHAHRRYAATEQPAVAHEVPVHAAVRLSRRRLLPARIPRARSHCAVSALGPARERRLADSTGGRRTSTRHPQEKHPSEWPPQRPLNAQSVCRSFLGASLAGARHRVLSGLAAGNPVSPRPAPRSMRVTDSFSRGAWSPRGRSASASRSLAFGPPFRPLARPPQRKAPSPRAFPRPVDARTSERNQRGTSVRDSAVMLEAPKEVRPCPKNQLPAPRPQRSPQRPCPSAPPTTKSSRTTASEWPR
jgi:hypothetical protein